MWTHTEVRISVVWLDNWNFLDLSSKFLSLRSCISKYNIQKFACGIFQLLRKDKFAHWTRHCVNFFFENGWCRLIWNLMQRIMIWTNFRKTISVYEFLNFLLLGYILIFLMGIDFETSYANWVPNISCLFDFRSYFNVI